MGAGGRGEARRTVRVPQPVRRRGALLLRGPGGTPRPREARQDGAGALHRRPRVRPVPDHRRVPRLRGARAVRGVHGARRLRLVGGLPRQGCRLVGIRSSTEFEPEWVRLLGELYGKPVIPMGLFPPAPQQDVAGHEAMLRWLDGQAPNSVVYAAFGSEVKLTSVQLQRIALGLEASGLPFIWAFRAPTDAASGGLPEGFEERIAGRGLVYRGWVPQVRFLTHAGWNSITEGLTHGVRLVLLPMVFEQGLNARNLVDKKIGVEVARDEQDGSFAPDDIAAALRRVMVEDEGEQFGAKVKDLAKVFGDDEVNDQCVREFLRHLSEHSKKNQG